MVMRLPIRRKSRIIKSINYIREDLCFGYLDGKISLIFKIWHNQLPPHIFFKKNQNKNKKPKKLLKYGSLSKILIACCPSIVCPSVCKLLLQNHWANFNQTWRAKHCIRRLRGFKFVQMKDVALFKGEVLRHVSGLIQEI